MAIDIIVGPMQNGQRVFNNVIGHALLVVIKGEDGSITVEREFVVNADNVEDNELVEGVIKATEREIAKVLPDPNQAPETPKIWIPE